MSLQKIDLNPEELAQESVSEAEKLARSLRREADRLAAEREKIRKEDDVKRIVIDKASHEQGRSDGKSGRESTVPPGVDSFSYYSGYIEGKAIRERTKCHRFVPEDPGKERG